MLTFQSNGSGKDIVLLHGFCENSTCFNEQVLLLKDHYKVTVIDLPGVAHSPYIEELSMEKCADEVHRTLMHIGISSCLMIGHSMGGYVTLSFAKKYPEFLKGFGLLHSTSNPDSDERRSKRDQAIKVIQDKGHEFYISNFIPPLFASSFNNPMVVERIINEGKRITSKAIIAQLLSMKFRPSSNDFLKETDLPVLFIAGKHDAIIPVSDVIKQSAYVHKGSLVILPNAAHMGMIEDAEACSEAIKQFASTFF